MDNQILGMIILFNLLFVILVFTLFLKGLRYKKKACVILPIRISVKTFIFIWSVFVLTFFWPKSVYFFWCVLCFSLLFFLIDVVFVEKGVFFGVTFIPWEDISALENHKWYFLIKTKKSLANKGFLKLFWKINQEDLNKALSIIPKSVVIKA